jgi:polyferredoxin
LNFEIFLGIVVVLFLALPFLSSKKWCHAICPIGAGLSVIDRATPFRITVDQEDCNKCGACLDVCPTFGFARRTDGTVYVTDTCDKCLVCLYNCPSRAIDLRLYNIRTDAKKFLMPSATILGAFWFYWFVVVICELVAAGAFR